MQWLTRSLFVRLFLIVLGGVVVAIALTTALAQHDRSRLIEEFRGRFAIGYVTNAIRLLATLSPQARISAADALPSSEWFVDFGPLARDTFDELTPEFADMLTQRLGDVAQVTDAWLGQAEDCTNDTPACRGRPHMARVRVRFPDGQVALVVYQTVPPTRPQREELVGFPGRVAVFVAIMTIISWLVVRIALRPLQRMAQAAEDFGRDMAHAPMDTSGPTEVRRAAQAFNAMQERIRSYMAERTQILSAITHDLRTPLTRMRLRLEHCADLMLKSKLEADIATMQSLVEEGLELARSLDSTETTQLVNLDALLQSLCDDASEAGQDVRYETSRGPDSLVAGRPQALRRVFTNLIDNAVKYGHYARVSLERGRNVVRVRVCDGGGGIPEDRLLDVLKPFVRLDSSRCRDTGGTGLGLAIAANLLKSQHGTLSLRNRPGGGLEATVELKSVSPGK